jgi:hypothetical protein
MIEATSAILFDVTIQASGAQSPAMLAGETRPMLRSRPKHRQSFSWHQPSIHAATKGDATVITCIIRYHIDPTKKMEFEQYARNWGQAIPRCGADLVGYFAPHEGSTTLAYGIYSIDGLAAYEQYKLRLAADSLARENFEFAKRERFITREDRTFLRLASTPHSPLVKP